MGRDRAYVGGDPLSAGTEQPGAALSLTRVVCQGAGTGEGAAAGVSLRVSPSQTVALFSRPSAAAVELLDAIGGLRRPREGEIVVDDIAVHRLRGATLDRYRRGRGIISTRFPLLPSLSVSDNVLAAAWSRRVDARTRERALQLLEVTGARQLGASLAGRLTAEQQWRVLIARALLPFPRLVLAEDPSPGMESRDATVILDVLMDARAQLGFTLLLAVGSLATASRCERLVRLADGAVAEDELTRGDDAWTRDRIDRIG